MIIPSTPQGLFTTGTFTSHSGELLHWKIDADALTEEDLATLAAVAVRRLPPFGYVFGIPRGGERFAKHLEKYRNVQCFTRLIVDDVLTTGASMKAVAFPSSGNWVGWPVTGLVIFARGPCPGWVMPMFTLDERLQ